MARMSIDDMLSRDPRLMRLAKLCGWSKRETAGALVLDVWPLCYDRERSKLPVADVDAAAELDGFALKMVESGLAVRVGDDQIRISGAKHRIEYLRKKQQAGSKGGRKSGESRRNRREANSKQTASTPQAPANPSPSASVLDPALAREESARDATPPDPFDPAELKRRRDLALRVWREVSDRRIAIAAELGLPAPIPFAEITPATCPQSFRDLLERIREEGTLAEQVCLHVLEVLTSEARDTRSLEWLAEKAFREGSWRTARGKVPRWRPKPADDGRYDMPPMPAMLEAT